ncbi:MAG: AraC family transcriptional regulator [Pseudomonadota bacterium]
MSNASPVQSQKFDVADIEPRYRIEAMRTFLPFKVTQFELVGNDPHAFKAQTEMLMVNGLSVGHHVSSGFRASTHKPGTDGSRFLYVIKYVKGTRRYSYDGSSYETVTDKINIADIGRWTGMTCDGPIHSVFALVPYELVGFEEGQQNDRFGHPLDAVTHEVLDANLELLGNQLPTASADEANLLQTVFTGVVRSVLRYPRKLDEFSHDMLQTGREVAVRRYISQNFARRDLTVEEVCFVCGISRSTLYRIFRDEGGFANYVTAQRLSAAFRQLTRTTARRGLVRYVADNWGFSNQSHFARLFRKAYGFPASDIIGSALED